LRRTETGLVKVAYATEDHDRVWKAFPIGSPTHLAHPPSTPPLASS